MISFYLCYLCYLCDSLGPVQHAQFCSTSNRTLACVYDASYRNIIRFLRAQDQSISAAHTEVIFGLSVMLILTSL